MFAAKAGEESSVVFESLRMPPKYAKKRQRQLSLEKAREEKRRRSAGESSTEVAGSGAASHEDDVNDMADLLDVSIHELDTDNEYIDPSFDLDASMKSDMTTKRPSCHTEEFLSININFSSRFVLFISLCYCTFSSVANVALCITSLLENLYDFL